jgi:hypothetical protein
MLGKRLNSSFKADRRTAGGRQHHARQLLPLGALSFSAFRVTSPAATAKQASAGGADSATTAYPLNTEARHRPPASTAR